MNGISLASTPKGCIQHQNQSSSTQESWTHNLWTKQKTSTISQGAGWITHWIKKAARMKLAVLLALSDSAGRVTGKSSFLAVHGGQRLWLSMCWLLIASSSCASNTVTSTPEALNLRPAWDFPDSFPEEADTSFSLLFFFLQASDICRTSLSQCHSYPRRKHNKCLQGRRMQHRPVQRRFVNSLAPADPRCQGTHTLCRPVTCLTCRDSVGAEKVQSQLYPLQSSHGTSHWEQPEDSEIPGGSGKPPSDLLFPNFPFLLLPVLKSSSASWS